MAQQFIMNDNIDDFQQKLSSSIQNGIQTAKRIKEEKQAAAKKLAEEEKRKRQEEKFKKIFAYVGTLPDKIQRAAQKGENYVTIDGINEHDIERNCHIINNLYSPKSNTVTYDVIEYLKGFKDIKVSIDCHITRDSGVYNEILKYYHYFIKVEF